MCVRYKNLAKVNRRVNVCMFGGVLMYVLMKCIQANY